LESPAAPSPALRRLLAETNLNPLQKQATETKVLTAEEKAIRAWRLQEGAVFVAEVVAIRDSRIALP